jgi:cyclophilin family peptidyl-prolyl cis-trans isomerase
MDLDENYPKTVANFVFLAREGFYNGLTWHRVEPDVVIQAGDPDGVAGVDPDGPGYTIPDEPPRSGRVYTYGVVGMANTGKPNSGGSQFFVVLHDPTGKQPAGLPPNYSILGKIDPSSYEVLETISHQKTYGSAAGSDIPKQVRPIVPVYINSIEIVED